MSTFLILLISVLIVILSSITFILLKKGYTAINQYLGFVFLCAVFWNLCILLMILSPWYAVKVIFYYLKYVAISALPVFSLVCILSFLKLDTLITKKILAILFFIPVVYLVIISTNNINHFFASTIDVKSVTGLNIIVAKHSWAFWIATGYSYFIYLVDIFILALNSISVANLYKKHIGVLIASTIIPLSVNSVYMFFNLSGKLFDFTPIFLGFTLLLITFAISHYNFTDIIPISRIDIFKTNLTPIIVLDTHERIVDMNPSAEKVFKNNLSDFCGQNVSILDKYFDENVISNNDVKVSMDSKVYIDSKVYNVKHSIIYNSKGFIIGSYKSFYDITTEEKYLNELKFLSFHDALTGLYNRTYYNMIVDKIQTEENLPFCIVLGDLNGLKTINDTLGHRTGDEVIKLAADILENNFNNNALVFRFGGDEFCILAKKASEDEIKKIFKNINNDFAQIKEYSVSISLGYSIKRDFSDSFIHFFSEADAKMYKEKNKHKLL